MTDINNSNVATAVTTQEIVQDISVISQAISVAGKDWWKSKILWVNIVTVIASVSAYFGFDFQSHGINPHKVATSITTILGIANVVLRIYSTTNIKPILPQKTNAPSNTTTTATTTTVTTETTVQ